MTGDGLSPVDILYVGFNADFGCFACGNSAGFRVFNCDPFKETICRDFNTGGIGIVELLFRCNIMAIVGGGSSPKYPPTKVMIWDDHLGKGIGELTFRSQVRAVRLRRDRIVVALEHKVLVYNFADLKLLHQIETLANTRGLVAISTTAESTVLACPGLHSGQVRVELYDRRQTRFISAHTNALSCLALSLDGKRLVTASDKGTLVRIWNTADGTKCQELRRGADTASIYSLSLSKHCDWLAVSSDKGTVHVFSLSEAVRTGPDEGPPGSSGGSAGKLTVDGGTAGNTAGDAGNGTGPGAAIPVAAAAAPRTNPTSLFSMVKGLVPSLPMPKYFSSEWSFAQFRVIEPDAGRVIAGFGSQPHTLVVVTAAGWFYKLSFDPVKGGHCTQESKERFDRAAGDL